jgi:hypothetical protein
MTDVQTICLAILLCNLTTCLTVAGCWRATMSLVSGAIARHERTDFTKVVKIGVKQK